MTVSQKQLEANRRNAQKGGVKTPEGKAITRYNALKHGLLAKEVVIAVGDGAEDAEAFADLLGDLKTELKPTGTLEEMFMEKIAVSYWRLMRACRYEAGAIRSELDDAARDFYAETGWSSQPKSRPDEEIDHAVQGEREAMESLEQEKRDLACLCKEGKALEEVYDRQEIWECLVEDVYDHSDDDEDLGDLGSEEIRRLLKERAGWSDEVIWQRLIKACDEEVAQHENRIGELEAEKERNRLKLQVVKRLGSLVPVQYMDRLLRYEGAIERQLYKALNQLERLQRLRAGDRVPPPLEVDVHVNAGQEA